jgi:Toxin PAAR-like domain
MSKNVFANGKGISAKKDDNKSIAAMPDVCNSPPSPPAGPVPIPYPNTAQASDTSDGSKTVMIGGGEVGMKNSSNYKKSTGDEAATKALGMNLTTHTIQGIMKHAAWSMDVKIEGANAIRHMDMTTHNHMNTSGTGSTTVNQELEQAAKVRELTCEELSYMNEHACENQMEPGAMDESITVTTAQKTAPNGRKKFMKACSNGDAPRDGTGKWEPARKEKTRFPGCRSKKKKGKYGYRNKNHTEPKLLEGLKKGDSIKMSIYHQTAHEEDAMPCGSCKNTICVAEMCGIKVTLCNQRNEEVKAEDLCDKGRPKPVGGTGQEKDIFWTNAGL